MRDRRAVATHLPRIMSRIRRLRKDNLRVPLRANRRGHLVPGTFHGPMVIAQPLPREKRCNGREGARELDAPDGPFGRDVAPKPGFGS
jgi:hypothetical protein